MSGYQTILFDLDGTLTDPGEGITKSVEYALNRYGVTVADRKDLYPFIGPPLIDSFMRFYGFSEPQAREAVEVYREYFRTKGIWENRVYPGVPELLKTLSEAGKTLLVASSKPEVFVHKILDHFGLARYFAFAGGALLDGSRTEKEDVLRYTLAACPNDGPAVLVGDRKFDVEGAHAVGIAAVGVTYGYGTEEEIAAARPEHIARTPAQILQFCL